MTLLVSILIPCYNAEKYVGTAVQSALDQTWPNKEIIVVDDGSTDRSLASARTFESARVRVITQPNSGQSAAENRAFSESQGDLIEYLDADDLLAPDKIEIQVRALQAHGTEHVASGEWARFRDSPADARFLPEQVWQSMPGVEWLACSWKGGGMMHGAAWLVPREIAKRAGPWDEQLSLINDFDFFARVLLQSAGVLFCKRARSFYRSGVPGCLSGSKSPAAWQSAFNAIKKGTRALLAAEDSIRTKDACATAFQRFVYDAYPDVRELVQQAEARVKELGGTALRLKGSRAFNLAATLLGWKTVKNLQRWRRYGLPCSLPILERFAFKKPDRTAPRRLESPPPTEASFSNPAQNERH